MQITLNNFANYLIILLPAFLVSGPFLSELSVILIDIIFLYLLYREKNFKYLDNNFFKFLICFNIYISLRSIFTEDLLFSLKSSLTYVRFTFLIFAIKFFLERNEKLLNTFSKIILLTIFILFSDALFQYVNGYNFLGFKIENHDKLNSFFGNEGVLGSYLVRLLPLFLVCYLNLNQNSHGFIIAILVFGLFIFLAGSRSAIFLYILFVILFFLIFTEFRKSLVFYISMISVFLILIFSSFNLDISPKDQNKLQSNFKDKISYTIYYNVFDPVRTILNKNSKKNEIKIFTPVYDAHYRTAYKMFQDNFLFGVGNKMYRKLCDNKKYYTNEYSCSTHPHNLYLQILAENGILGSIFVFIIFFYCSFVLFKEFIYRNFKKKKKLNNKFLLLIIGVFINFWPIVPFGNFYNNWLSILIYLPIGFLLYFRKKNDQ